MDRNGSAIFGEKAIVNNAEATVQTSKSNIILRKEIRFRNIQFLASTKNLPLLGSGYHPLLDNEE